MTVLTVLTAVRKVLEFEMTIAEWIGTVAMLAVPYLVVGVAWTVFFTDLSGEWGSGRIVSLLVSIVVWPALLINEVCLA